MQSLEKTSTNEGPVKIDDQEILWSDIFVILGRSFIRKEILKRCFPLNWSGLMNWRGADGVLCG